MTLELAIVDTDLTTVLLNLNGVDAGSATGFRVRHINLGQVDPETEFISNPAYPGAVQTVTHHGPVEMELALQARHTSYDGLRNLVGSIVEYLRDGGIMRYKFDGQTNYRYIEFFGSQLPQLIRGEDITQKYIIEKFRDDTGFPLVIRRQPYVFEANRTVLTSQEIRNDNAGDQMAQIVNVNGDLPALAKLSVKVPSSSAEVVHLRVGRRSSGSALTEYRENFVNYAITSPATISDAWKRIHRQVLTPTSSTALEGTYRVFAALKLLDEDVYHVQLRWGTVDADPAGAVNEDVVLDSADTQAMNQFADIDLGRVRFDRSGSSLVLEIWARREGAGDISWNDVWLQPIEELSFTVSAPGFRFGRFAREGSTGNELIRAGGAGLDDDDRAVLNDVDEYCETANRTLPVGMHLVQFIGTVINANKIRQDVGKLEVLEDSVTSTDRRVKLTSRRKYTRVHYDHDNPKQVSWKTTDVTKNYRWRVTQTVSNSANRAIKVERLVYSFVPVLSSNRQFVLDGISGEAFIADATGARQFPAHLTGPFLTLEPGDNVLVFRLGDANTKPVFREADARGKLPEMISSRVAEVTIVVRERFIV